MYTLDEAIEKIKELKNTYYFNRQSEMVGLNDSIGRELSKTIFANTRSPEFDIASMDGFAVCSKDTYPLRTVGKIYAGDEITRIKSGEAIATGAFMPHGADAVLKIEDAKLENNLLYDV